MRDQQGAHQQEIIFTDDLKQRATPLLREGKISCVNRIRSIASNTASNTLSINIFSNNCHYKDQY